MPKFGWKYNMDNIHAAILLAQLKKFPKTIKKRKKLTVYYKSFLKKIPQIQLFADEKKGKHANHLMPILVPQKLRNSIISKIKKVGIQATVNYTPLHKLTYFKNQKQYKQKVFPHAENIGKRVLSLPFYPDMSPKKIDFICKTLKSLLEKK